MQSNRTITAKAVREGAVFMVGGGMPSKGDGGRATDTSRPHRAYGHRRNTDNRQRLRGKHRGRCFYLWDYMPFIRVLSRRCCIRIFTNAPSLTAWQQSTSRDSDMSPSCVVGISQTRLSGTGQCHYKSKEYNLCSFNQWPSANAGSMNSPSKDIPMRFMTFSDAILGTAVKEYSLLHNFFSCAYFIHAIAASVAYPLFQNLSDIRQPISHPGAILS